MTAIHFQKWQATGNDFIIVDNRNRILKDLPSNRISRMCDRNFGIGADGFMIIQSHPDLDFEMRYFNADGNEAEMCGNGARSIIGFAKSLGIIADSTTFQTIDGIHNGWITRQDNYRIKMVDIDVINSVERGIFLNTGVPHLVIMTTDPDQIAIVKQGREIRYSEEFAPDGTNVNFINNSSDVIRMRTYERGVENETLSCGTGAVASAIATEYMNNSGKSKYEVQAPGGLLNISFNRSGTDEFKDIYLEGEAKMVFKGDIELSLRN